MYINIYIDYNNISRGRQILQGTQPQFGDYSMHRKQCHDKQQQCSTMKREAVSSWELFNGNNARINSNKEKTGNSFIMK